jgi:hypothetical protein
LMWIDCLPSPPHMPKHFPQYANYLPWLELFQSIGETWTNFEGFYWAFFCPHRPLKEPIFSAICDHIDWSIWSNLITKALLFSNSTDWWGRSYWIGAIFLGQ